MPPVAASVISFVCDKKKYARTNATISTCLQGKLTKVYLGFWKLILISTCRSCNFVWWIWNGKEISNLLWRIDKSGQNSFRSGRAILAKISTVIAPWCWFETSLVQKRDHILNLAGSSPNSWSCYWAWWK